MKNSHKTILDSVTSMISNGQGLSLLQKLGMDIQVNNWNELTNYLFICQILLEQPEYFAESSNLILKRFLLNLDAYKFLDEDKEKIYNELFTNRVLPYIGLSTLIRNLLRTCIKQQEAELDIIRKIPSKSFLSSFNLSLLKDYLSSQTDINNATSLLYNCWLDLDLDDKIILNVDAVNLYRQYLDEHILAFDEYLRFFLRFQWYGGSRDYHEGKLIVPEPFFRQIFGSITELLTLIKKNKDDGRRYLSPDTERLYNDIQKFLFLYEKNQYIEYDNSELNLEKNLHINVIRELNRN